MELPADCAQRFRALRPLASGGYGTVWLAEQVALSRPAAVKVLSGTALVEPEAVSRFLEEARITASIRHPHVVVVLDSGVDAGVPWIAYELIEGDTLRRLAQRGRLTPLAAAQYSAQVARALDAAHQRGILHRDIKPENVLLAAPEHAKVVDFGIAKWSQGAQHRTRTGVILGTPAYMAPEVIDGHEGTAAADQYALGVMLYELLAGRPPYVGDSFLGVMEQHLAAQPARLAGPLPDGLETVVMRAMQRVPEDRFDSAAQLAEALEALEGEPRESRRSRLQAPDPGPRTPDPGRTPRSRGSSGTRTVPGGLGDSRSGPATGAVTRLLPANRGPRPAVAVSVAVALVAGLLLLRPAREPVSTGQSPPAPRPSAGEPWQAPLRQIEQLLAASETTWEWSPRGPGLAAAIAAALEAHVPAAQADTLTERFPLLQGRAPPAAPLARAALAAWKLQRVAGAAHGASWSAEPRYQLLAAVLEGFVTDAHSTPEMLRLAAAAPFEHTAARSPDNLFVADGLEADAWRLAWLGLAVRRARELAAPAPLLGTLEAARRAVRPAWPPQTPAPAVLPAPLTPPQIEFIRQQHDGPLALRGLNALSASDAALREAAGGPDLEIAIQEVLLKVRDESNAVRGPVRASLAAWIEQGESRFDRLPGYWLARGRLLMARFQWQPEPHPELLRLRRSLALRGIDLAIDGMRPGRVEPEWPPGEARNAESFLALVRALADSLIADFQPTGVDQMRLSDTKLMSWDRGSLFGEDLLLAAILHAVNRRLIGGAPTNWWILRERASVLEAATPMASSLSTELVRALRDEAEVVASRQGDDYAHTREQGRAYLQKLTKALEGR